MKMIAKLKSNKGESIAEVLVAMLIVSLASVMFAGMVTASNRLVQKSDTAYNEYITEHNNIESGGGSIVPDQTIKVEPANTQGPNKADIVVHQFNENIKLKVSDNKRYFVYDANK